MNPDINNGSFNQPLTGPPQNLSEINYNNYIYSPNLYSLQGIPNYYMLNNSYLTKKRESDSDKFYAQNPEQQRVKEESKCYACYTSMAGEIVSCVSCWRTFHFTCLFGNAQNVSVDDFQCSDCKLKIYQLNQGMRNQSMYNWYPNPGIMWYPDTNLGDRTNYLNINLNNKDGNCINRATPQVPSKEVRETIPEKQYEGNSVKITEESNNVNADDCNKQANELNALLISVLENQNMTNEERLTHILENNKGIQLHPLIIRVMNERKKKVSQSWMNKWPRGNNNNTTSLSSKSNIISPNAQRNTTSNQQWNDNDKRPPSQGTPNQSYQNDAIIKNTPQPPKQAIKYPMDDILLFQTPEIFDIPQETMVRPKGNEIKISFSIYNKLIIVWDFLKTFHDTLDGETDWIFENAKKIEYFVPNDIEEFYNDWIDNKNEYFKKIWISFIVLSVKSLKILDVNWNDKEMFIIKSFLDNVNSSTYDIISNCTKEVINGVIKCISYKHLVSQESNLIVQEWDDVDIWTPEKKVIWLNNFVGIAYETIIIKGKIRNEFEKSSSWSIDKSNWEETLKESEKRRNDIINHSNFSKIQEKIEFLHGKIKEYKEDKEQAVNNKEISKWELEVEKLESFVKENKNLELRKNEILEKIKQTKEKLIALKVPRKRSIGSDYEKNEYFYFNCIPGKLYIKHKKKKQWSVIDKKDDILDLANKLSEKGFREKKLKFYIKRVIHEITLNEKKLISQADNQDNNKEKVQQEENNNREIELWPEQNTDSNPGNPVDLSTKPQETKPKDNDIEMDDESATVSVNTPLPEQHHKYTINEILIKIEEKFTEYLKQFNKEWECSENRSKWKSIWLTTTNISNFISTLQMFNYRFKNPYKTNLDNKTEENEESEGSYSIPEDLKKFVFITEANEEFVIYESDPTKNLSPKVKIWSKEIELAEVDKYFTNEILPNLTLNSKQRWYFALHFYENVIFSLIKRRETKKAGHGNGGYYI